MTRQGKQRATVAGATPGQRATLTLREAGHVLGLGNSSTYKAVCRGDIPSIRIGGRILIPRAGLERLLGGQGRT